MQREISKLPREIQQHIRDAVPEFTRLSRNDYVGKEALFKQCYDDITKNELLEYVVHHYVESFILYSTNKTYFNIDLYQVNPPKTFLGYEYGVKSYRRTRLTLNLHNIHHHLIFLINVIVPDNTTNDLNIRDILQRYRNFNCDIVTVYDILQQSREECKMIPQFNKKFIFQQINNIINNQFGYEELDLNTIRNKIIKLIYLYTNYHMLLLDYVGMDNTGTQLNMILSQIHFSYDEKIIDDKGVARLNQLYDFYLEKLNNYVNHIL